MKNIVAICGMPGAGKSELADFFIKKGFDYIRLGQLTLDEVKKRGLKGENAEKIIRERLRKEYGMAAFATLNFPAIDKLGEKVIVDNIISWEEYLAFRKKYPKMILVTIVASPQTRYQRLINRAKKHGPDPKLKYRSFSLDEAKSRDISQITNINSGGPIAMADFTIVNEGTKIELVENLNKIYRKINAKKS